MACVPKVEQHVARSRVESARSARDGQIGQVRDAADVDDDAVNAAAEERRVERRHEGRALPARGDVAAPEVGDHGHVGLLGDARRIVELQRPALLRSMPDRLPMDARSDDVVRRHAGGEADAAQRVRVQVGELVGRARRVHDLVVRRRLQREQLLPQLRRKGDVRRSERNATASPPAAKSASTASMPSRLVPDITPA